jgi:hypothetical protein
MELQDNSQERISILEKQLQTELEEIPKRQHQGRFLVRDLEDTDYEKGFPNILNELSTVGDYSKDEFLGIDRHTNDRTIR